MIKALTLNLKLFTTVLILLNSSFLNAHILGNDFPIELVFFNCEVHGSDSELRWTTSTETNNSYFFIERSEDGVEFDIVGKVESDGTTQNEHEYVFVDPTPKSLTHMFYYRLELVDDNGESIYSEVVEVSF